MHICVNNLIEIKKEIKSKNFNSNSKIIAVSKTFSMEKITPLINYGHLDFGENKVQEAIEKWTIIKKKNPNLKLHMIGKLQTNKTKQAIKLFDYIHSLDSIKLAKKISDEQKKIEKKIKIFIQVNVGSESQKSGISILDLNEFYKYCTSVLKLDIVGLMCIPPINNDPNIFFKKMNELLSSLNLSELSMGMSSDYLIALKYNSTYLRIGSKIFGIRN
ncbi:YggS family pyridoxal phosphate-dependent enzyme [Candidatus Pelagibacter sp.]|nr:YggS family pyridoxal phosphate-dependent enzyme [Candidatus Pelagibacter sp.]